MEGGDTGQQLSVDAEETELGREEPERELALLPTPAAEKHAKRRQQTTPERHGLRIA